MITIEKELLEQEIRKTKGDIMEQFELLCPTNRSFDRALRRMHNIFDSFEETLLSSTTKD